VADQDERTPLHLAALNGHENIVKFLMAANVRQAAEDKRGWTAFHSAAANGHSNVIKALLFGNVDLTKADKSGETALHLAARKGHVQVLLLLLERRGSVGAVNLERRTPLHLAAGHGHTEAVKILLSWNSDVLVQDKEGKTALHLATLSGHANVVDVLLKTSTDVRALMEMQDKDGRTAIHHAAWNGLATVITHMLNAGVDTSMLRDNFGRTTLHRAAANGHFTIVKMLIDRQVNETDHYGRTALNIAAEMGHSEVVQTLLDAKADPTIPDGSGLTSLMYAASGGWNRTVAILAANIVDINARGRGWTALHHAVHCNHVETVKLLLGLGADETIGHEGSESPLDLARQNGSKEMVAVLQHFDHEAPNRDLVQTIGASSRPCLRTHQPRSFDLQCQFNTHEISSGTLTSPRCSKGITFPIPYAAPPRIAVGLYRINMSPQSNIRIKTYADEVLPDRFRIHIDAWAGSILYSGGSTWFAVAEDDRYYQFGSFNTLEDHAWDEPQAITKRRIEFVRPYDCPPEVVLWFDFLDMADYRDWRVGATANEIDSTGFTLQIEALGNCALFGGGVSWIAYPAWKGGVVSGRCRTEGLGIEGQANDSDVLEATGTAKFKGGGFLTTPRVFVAFNMLSVSRGNQMNLEVTIRSVTKSDLTWCIRGWDTKIDIAEASYIAIC